MAVAVGWAQKEEAWTTVPLPDTLPRCVELFGTSDLELAGARRPQAMALDSSAMGGWDKGELLRAHGNETVQVGTADEIAAFDGHAGSLDLSLASFAVRPGLQLFDSGGRLLRRMLGARRQRGHGAFRCPRPFRAWCPAPFVGAGRAAAAAPGAAWAVLSIGSATADDRAGGATSARCGMQWHQHGAAWLALLRGAKEWWLLPAGTPHSAADSAALAQPPSASASCSQAAAPRGSVHCVQRAGEILFLPEGTHHATRNIGDALAAGAQAAWPARRRLAASMAAVARCAQIHREGSVAAAAPPAAPGGGARAGAGCADVAAYTNAAIGFGALLERGASGGGGGGGGQGGGVLRTAAQRQRAARAAVKQLRAALRLAPLCLRCHFALLRALHTQQQLGVVPGGGAPRLAVDVDVDGRSEPGGAQDYSAAGAAARVAALTLDAAASALARAISALEEQHGGAVSAQLVAAAHQRLGVWHARRAMAVLEPVPALPAQQPQAGAKAAAAAILARAHAHVCVRAAALCPQSIRIRGDCRSVELAKAQLKQAVPGDHHRESLPLRT